jgi:hypothetical protein
MKNLTQAWGMSLLSMVCGLLAVGCNSLGGPASASFASVTIKGRSVQQIRDMSAAVFRENGYEAFISGQTLVFDKEGSRMNTLSRDGLIATQAGASTIVRVRAEVVELGADSHRLQAQAFMVSGAGDSFFEEEHRLTNMRSRPYQNILDDIAKRLKKASPDPKP